MLSAEGARTRMYTNKGHLVEMQLNYLEKQIEKACLDGYGQVEVTGQYLWQDTVAKLRDLGYAVDVYSRYKNDTSYLISWYIV